jgi:asparagine synthase (glutamine-hydrolysing)
MIRLDVHSDDLAAQWSWQGGMWRSGSSWIAALESPALRRHHILAGQGLRLEVREVWANGDFVEVEIAPRGTLQLTAGPLGVAPLYISTCGSRIVGSWDPVDLTPFASADSLSPAVVARLLTRRHRYSAETVFSRISRVTAGRSACRSFRQGRAARTRMGCLRVEHNVATQLQGDAVLADVGDADVWWDTCG